MNKTLLLKVNCVNEHNSSAPNAFVIDLDKQSLQRLRDLVVARESLGVDSIIDAMNDGSYFRNHEIEDIANEINLDSMSNAKKLTTIDLMTNTASQESMVELKASVNNKGLFFYAIPEYADKSEICETVTVPLSDLDSIEPYIDILGN